MIDCLNRYNGDSIQWCGDVALRSLQSVSGHSDHYAANIEDIGLHCRFNMKIISCEFGFTNNIIPTETCVFAYLGLAIFSFRMKIEIELIIWAIILCLIGRAANIFPLSYLVNYFREHKISKKMMFVMWFSGLRGAIAYALALHLEFEEEKRRVVVTTTLIIVLFTIIFLGGLTMPVMKVGFDIWRSRHSIYF